MIGKDELPLVPTKLRIYGSQLLRCTQPGIGNFFAVADPDVTDSVKTYHTGHFSRVNYETVIKQTCRLSDGRVTFW